MEEKILIEGNAKGAKHIPIIVAILSIISFVAGFVAVEMAEDYMLIPLCVLGVFLLVASITLFVYCNNCTICVTNKRVYGKASFGARVDLPIDSISAVGVLTIWNGISVATSSGAIKFLYIKNADDIHKTLSNIIVNRQGKVLSTSSSSADELKKYKELFDDGTITQEEFDEKKKQLLGL